MTAKQTFKENKLFTVIMGAVAAGLITWGAWVTVETFSKAAAIRTICADVDEVQLTQKEAKGERKELQIAITKNHTEVLLLLMNIQKEIQKNNRK